MNLILRGIKYQNFQIYNGDTIAEDNFGDKKFRVQLSNPPYSASISRPDLMPEDPRFNSYGKYAPKSKADFAFLQHMVYHMDDDGRIAVLLPHGVLFRGGAEETIRRYMIEKLNVIDAIIGLPANLFYGTAIPVAIIVCKKNRNGNSNNILFIDASKCSVSGKNQNVLTEDHIRKIFEAYQERKDIDRFSHVASIDEIVENGFNLNISRYVDISEPEPNIDISKVQTEIADLQMQKTKAMEDLNKMMKLLGL